MGHWHDVTGDLQEPTPSLREKIGGAWSGFSSLHKEATADGVTPARIKEAMALAIAVPEQCDGCIAFHARTAPRSCTTEDEVAKGSRRRPADERRPRHHLWPPHLGGL